MALGRLLLAENDQSLSRALTLRLRHAGFHVHAVDNGTAVLEAIRQIPPDVVLLDLRLPGVDGLGVLKQLQREPGGPAVVLMSGHLDAETTVDAIRFGAAEVLEKPVAPKHLFKVLHDVMGSAHRGETAIETGSQQVVSELIGSSPAIERLRDQIVRVLPFSDLPILIMGETGTGKELVARAIHRLGGVEGPLIAVNCAAMPESLFESELFGHTAGSFTGAKTARRGLLEAAGKGTVFFDEVGELPPPLQAKLLRVLESRRFRRVGSEHEIALQARIVSATNRELASTPHESFREDLFYRLAGYTLRTPSLRERMGDLGALAEHFLSDLAHSHASVTGEISQQALCALQTHAWPGNVRELRGVLRSAMIRAGGRIEVRHVVDAIAAQGTRDTPPTAVSPREERQTLPALERALVQRAYEECRGNLSRAARQLNVPRTTLRDKVRRYGLRRPATDRA